jgi:hypothetical protein
LFGTCLLCNAGAVEHFPLSVESVEWLVTNCENEIEPGKPFIQSVEQIRSREQWLPQIRKILFGLLDVL